MKDAPWSSALIGKLAETPYFDVLLHDVTVNDGTHRTYYTLNFPRPAVGVVAVKDGKTLLLHQYRFIVDEYVWAIPSGGVAEGETPEDAARRELEEESGYRAGSLRTLLRCYASYGCSDQEFHIFLAEDVEPCDRLPDRNEVLDVQWFDHSELLELVLSNGIVDNLSLSPLLLVALNRALARS